LTDDEPLPSNEIVVAARQAGAVERAATAPEPPAHPERRWPVSRVGVGLGIGSAALAAALLYAGRNRK